MKREGRKQCFIGVFNTKNWGENVTTEDGLYKSYIQTAQQFCVVGASQGGRGHGQGNRTGLWRPPEELGAYPLVAGSGGSGEERAPGEGPGQHTLQLLLDKSFHILSTSVVNPGPYSTEWANLSPLCPHCGITGHTERWYQLLPCIP